MEPFSITCTTCQAKLKICDEAIVGQIHACPRCGSMVQISPPPGEPSASANKSTGEPEATAPGVVGQPVASASDAIPASQLAAGRGWWADARVAWVCVPVVALLSSGALWLSIGPAKDSSGEQVAAVPDVAAPANTPVADAPGSPTKVPTADAPDVPKNPPVADAPGSPKEPPTPLPQLPPVSPPRVEPAPAAASMPVAVPLVPPVTQVTPTAAPSSPLQASGSAPVTLAPTVTVPPAMRPPAEKNPPAPSVAPNLAPTSQPAPAAEPSPPQPSEALPTLDIEKLLQVPVEAFTYQDKLPFDIFREISKLTSIPIAIDWEGLTDDGLKIDQPITVKRYNATIRDILDDDLKKKQGFDYRIEDHQLVIAAPKSDPRQVVTEKHSVGKLEPDTPAQLAQLVKLIIEPESWADAGGSGTLRVEGQELVVEQTRAVQREIRRLFAGLHTLRDKQPWAAPRCRRADAKLASSIRANFFGPTPLATIVDDLRKRYGVMLLVDHAALAAAGKSMQTPISLTANDAPLGMSLLKAIEPQGLTLRVVDASVLEITTATAAAQKFELEFYPLGKLIGPGETADAVLAKVVKELPGVSWRPEGRGTLAIDAASAHLIVRHSQDVQRRVAELIEKQP